MGKHRVRRSLHTTERVVAIERARDLTVELRTPRPDGVPVAQFCDRYLEWARTAKPASMRDEKYRVAIIKAWCASTGLTLLNDITAQSVGQFRAHLLTRPIGHTTKTIGRASVNRYCAAMRRMFNLAREWGEYKGENPVSKVKFYREGAKVRPLTDAEVEVILSATDTIATRKYATALQREAPALFRFILQTGLRRSEALNLRWSDVGDDVITILGKGGKTRAIPLNAEARSILKGQRKDGPFVFQVPGRDSLSLMRRLTATISKNAGVHFHLHLLRHVFASRLLAAGVDIVTISQLLGHGASMTTLLYSHSNPKLQMEAVTKLGHRAADVFRKKRVKR